MTIKCPKCGTKINAAKAMGAKGGSVSSDAKKAANKLNALKRWSTSREKRKGEK